MTDPPPPGAPAGWYADGTDAGRLRWWNGSAWTDWMRPVGEVEPGPPAVAGAFEPLVVRGATGYVELHADELLYRSKPDQPPLQRIALSSILRVVISRGGDTFDLVLEGEKDRRRPSLFSERSLRKSARTSLGEWHEFLARLEALVAARRSSS